MKDSTKPFKATVTLRYTKRTETSNFATYEEALAFAKEEAKWENTKEVFIPADSKHHSIRIRGDFA